MRAATQVVKTNPPMRQTIDNINCQAGTPKPILPIIAMGEVKGITDNQTLTGPCDHPYKVTNRNKRSTSDGNGKHDCCALLGSTRSDSSKECPLQQISPRK